MADVIGHVRLTRSMSSGGYPRILLSLPQPLGRAIMEKDYTHVAVSVTEEGILLKPYRDENGKRTVTLPEFS